MGVGELVPDDAVTDGHVLLVVGKDLKVPSGLRSPGAAFSLPGVAAAPAPAVAAAPAVGVAAAPAAVAAAPAQQLAKASVPCVN
jgi:hypothetical protein